MNPVGGRHALVTGGGRGIGLAIAEALRKEGMRLTLVGRDPARLEAELKEEGKSEDELKAEYRGIAERRIRLGLLLSEVGRANNIEVKPDEITRAMIEQARRFPGQERQVMEYFQKNPEAAQSLRAPIFEDKVVDFIIEMADVSEKPVTKEELQKEAEAVAS